MATIGDWHAPSQWRKSTGQGDLFVPAPSFGHGLILTHLSVSYRGDPPSPPFVFLFDRSAPVTGSVQVADNPDPRDDAIVIRAFDGRADPRMVPLVWSWAAPGLVFRRGLAIFVGELVNTGGVFYNSGKLTSVISVAYLIGD